MIVLSLVITLVLAVPQAAYAFPPGAPCPNGTTTLAKYDWEDGVWVFDSEGGEGADVINFDEPYTRNSGTWYADPGILVSVIVVTDGNGNPGGAPVVDWDYLYVDPDYTSGYYDNDVMEPDPTKDISNLLFCGTTVPVALASFTGYATRGAVTIDWVTATEMNTAGFYLYRSTTPDGPQVMVTSNMLAAQGNGVIGASYNVTDTPGYGTFYYWLKDVDYSGQSGLHGPVLVKVLPAIRQPAVRPSLPGQ